MVSKMTHATNQCLDRNIAVIMVVSGISSTAVVVAEANLIIFAAVISMYVEW